MCSSGKKVTVKGHGGLIDIQGVTVAQVDDQVRLQKVETWFDPMEMFRQIAPNGITDENLTEPESRPAERQDNEPSKDGHSTSQEDKIDAGSTTTIPRDDETKTVTTNRDGVDEKVQVATGSEGPSGIAIKEQPEQEAVMTHDDMSKAMSSGCPFLNEQ